LLLCQRWGVNGVGGAVINGNGPVANEESVGYRDDDNDSGAKNNVPLTIAKASVSPVICQF
jgi:hypothetical protein